MKGIAVPPSCRYLVPVAAIVLHRHTTVRGPPTPLQCALLALKACRDAIAKLISLGQITTRRQVEALRMSDVDGLAIGSGIVGAAIGGGLHTLQHPAVQASIRIRGGAIDALVTDLHLKVTGVVRCDHVLKLDDLTGSVGCMQLTIVIHVCRIPTRISARVRPIVPPSARHGDTDIAMTVCTGETCRDECGFQHVARAGCSGT